MAPSGQMKLLAWNSQGLGRALTANQLKELCRLHSPQLVFISETKNQFCRVDFIWKLIGMDCAQIVDPIGQQSSVDWVVWGYFNDVLWADEKQGGRHREAWSLKAFRDFVAKLEAVDLGFSGYSFTWANRRGGNGLIKERLDRAFGISGQFRFDNRWKDYPGCKDVMCGGWQRHFPGSKMFNVFNKVRNTRKELRAWSKEQKFNARKRINELQGQLQEIGEDRKHGDYRED
ncbi:hypothetical protein Vadar_025101 [Vaccinium darrowii]|uniref:Uncharacterized protein n=1 Tax=Vaccinium darrowii TaxID=229202 RepID=A0ACB7ZDX4_9ERIC|nr:hypothetical protein Vadar_025101 [Vaccinium darrowii]